MRDLFEVLDYLKPYAKEALLATLFLGLVVAADLSIPRLVQVIIDEGVANQDMSIIVRTGLLMIAASVLSSLFMVANTIFSVRASRGLEADLRGDVFRKIQAFSFGNLDDFTTGQLLTRLSSDINQVRLIVNMGLRMFIRAPLMFIGSVGIMYATNVGLANIMILLPLVTLGLVAAFIRVVQPLFTQVQQRLESLNQVLQENLMGIRVVKAFVRRSHENHRFDDINQDLYSKSVRIAQLLAIFFPLILLVLNLGTVAVIYFGGIQVFQATGTLGQILAFNNYLFSTMFPVLMLSMMAGQISMANASSSRVIEVLNTEAEIQERRDAVNLDAVRGRVEFKDVTFRYHPRVEPVLKGISFVAEAGERVAILGATGSGKSTLINLIPRFYDASSGSVSIDGVDVKDVQIYSLRSKIGMSLQEAVLFSGSIRENISYGRPEASQEEVEAAAKMAQAHDFIISLTQGYESRVGQRGVNLSGGQKQRIAIARALLFDPRILILDDSTSEVDVKTEMKIEAAIEKALKGRTSFIIAQRVSTVLKADKILVLERGRIAAEGSHLQLMETSRIYREIYNSQLGSGGVSL